MSNIEDPNRPGYPNGGSNPHNNNHQSNNRHDRCCGRCITCLRVVIATIFIIVSSFLIIGLRIVGLVYLPNDPQFRVESFLISNFTLGNDLLDNFTSEIRLSVRNPNKKLRVVYGPLKASILYDSEFLSNTTIPRFSQGKKNETFFTANFADELIFLGRRAVVGIDRDRAMNGNVSFNLEMQSKVKFVAGKWWKTYSDFKLHCKDLVVSIPTDGKSGTLTSGPRQCRVHFSV